MIKLKDVLPEVAQEIKDGLTGYKAGCQNRIDKFKETNSKNRDKLVELYTSIIDNTPDSYLTNLFNQVDDLEVHALHCDSDECCSFYTQAPVNKTLAGFPSGKGKNRVHFLGLTPSVKAHLLAGLFIHRNKIISVEYHLYDHIRTTLLEHNVPIHNSPTRRGKV